MDKLDNKSSFLVFISVFGLSALLFALGFELFVTILPVVSFCIYFLLKSTRNWLYFFIYTIPFWNNLSSKSINPIDVIILSVWIFGLAFWFVNKVIIQKKRIIKNLADWFIVFFFFMLIFTLIMGVAVGESSLTTSISTYLRTAVILFYFPIRDEIDTKEKFKKFVLHLLISLLITYVAWAYLNYVRVTSAKNIYEVTRFERTNQETFSGGVIFGSIFYLSLNKFKDKLFFLSFTLLSGIALIITLSRVYWLTTILGLFIAFLFFDFKRKVNILIILVVLVVIFIIGLQLLAPQLAEFLLDKFSTRLSSSLDFTSDTSFLSRFDEFEKLFHDWKIYFFGGTGLAQSYSYYNSSFDLVNWVSPFVHNAYIHLSFKAGIPMAIMYFFLLFYYLIYGMSKINSKNSDFKNSLLLSSTVCIATFLIVNLITSTFSSRPGAVYLALIIAFINIAANFKNDK